MGHAGAVMSGRWPGRAACHVFRVSRLFSIEWSCSRYAHDLFPAFLILFWIGSLIIMAGFIAESAIGIMAIPMKS
jgi:hypothetical protein